MPPPEATYRFRAPGTTLRCNHRAGSAQPAEASDSIWGNTEGYAQGRAELADPGSPPRELAPPGPPNRLVGRTDLQRRSGRRRSRTADGNVDGNAHGTATTMRSSASNAPTGRSQADSVDHPVPN